MTNIVLEAPLCYCCYSSKEDDVTIVINHSEAQFYVSFILRLSKARNEAAATVVIVVVVVVFIFSY
jgi:hypothetical protein